MLDHSPAYDIMRGARRENRNGHPRGAATRWSRFSLFSLDLSPPIEYNTHMDELEYDYADDPWERSDDYNVFEEREIMNADEGRDEDFDLDYDYDRDEAPEHEPQEDFGHFGEMGLWD